MSYSHIWDTTAKKTADKYREEWSKDLDRLRLYDLAMKYLAAYEGKVINSNIKKCFPGHINEEAWIKAKDFTEDGRRFSAWWYVSGNRSHLTIRELNEDGYSNHLLPSIELPLPAGKRFDYQRFLTDALNTQEQIRDRSKAGLAYLDSGAFDADWQAHNRLVKAIESVWDGKPLSPGCVGYY